MLFSRQFTGDSMGQTASSQTGEQRRRSTRLTETIPLVVRGIDLLGQPFEERTSTMALSYHGCRYPSKHHLPKNTWVTLEVPGREAEEGRRCVRARVVWIQRPRSVRELFQIGAELETPSNVWGISMPPTDWITSPSVQPSPTKNEAAQPSTNERDAESPGFTPAISGAVPGPLAGYIDRLLADTRLRVAGPQVRGSEGMPDEISPLVRELSAQFERQTEKSAEAAASRAEELIRQTQEEIERERQENLEVLRKEWKKDLDRQKKEAIEQILAQVTEARQSMRVNLNIEWDANVKRARDLFAQFEEKNAKACAEIASTAASTAAKLEDIQRQFALAETASEQREEQQRKLAETPQLDEQVRGAGREQMQAEMAVAREQWKELLQSSLDSAVQRLVARMAEQSQAALANNEQRLTARLSELSQPVAETAAQAREALASVQSALEQELARARQSLGEIEQAANHMSEYSAQLEAASHDTVSELHRRLEGVLNNQTAEMTRRAESFLAGAAERLNSLLEASGQQSLARASAEIEGRIAPHLARAQEVLNQLAAREEQTEETLRVHRERLRQASEQNQKETVAMQAGLLAQLRGDFEGVRLEAITKWNEEVEASGVRAVHAVAEELTKTSEWHQKKAQNDLQSIADKVVEGASGKLEEASSGLALKFSDQLEELQERQVQQARGRLEAASGVVVGQLRSRFEEAAESAAKSFGGTLERLLAQARERFIAVSHTALEEHAGQLEAAAAEVHAKMEANAQHSLDEFKSRLGEQKQKSAAEAEQTFAAQLALTVDSLRQHSADEEKKWLDELEQRSAESVSRFEERLRTAADSWMVGSVRKLNDRGQNVIESLSKAAEQSLRQTCSRVFDGLATAMREKMLGTATQLAAGVPLPEDEPTIPEKSSKP